MKFLLSILLVALVGATGCRDGGGSPTPASSTTMRPDAATSTVAPQRDAPPTARRPAAPATVADRYGLTLANTMHPTVPAAIAKAGETGAGWIRLTCGWSWVEPQPGRFDWRRCDAVMAAAAAAGFRVLATLTPSSQWSTTAPTNMPPAEREWYPPADYGAFGRWVEAMVRHYPAVDYWEVGNEPDLRPFWPAPPGEYARLLAEAKEAAGRARPGAKIVLGGLSLGGSPGSLDEDFLTEILTDPVHPAAQSVDVANFHHYGPLIEARRRIDYVRAEFATVGARPPVWITEAGYASDPAWQRLAGYGRGPEGQARWMADMLPALLQLGADRVFWFQLFDGFGGPSFSTHGLLDRYGNAKPAFVTLTSLAAGSQRAGGHD